MKSSAKSDHPSPARPFLLDAHHRFAAACAIAGLTFLASMRRLTLPTQCVLAWDAFALTVVALAWVVICTKDPYVARRNARLQDSSATFLFVLVTSAATASLFAVGLLLAIAKKLSSTGLAAYIALSVAAIVFSWMLVHTIFALRYAHFYFQDARQVERDDISGGVLFPGKNRSPDYLDFAYFSFVIGMTCQVSDVQICSSKIRRLALVHGLISFAFNTAILAIFVNIIAGLVGQ
jgi:uncharacterized membrane protein